MPTLSQTSAPVRPVVLVNVKMPPAMVAELDNLAKRKDMLCRSDLIRLAVRDLLERQSTATPNV